MNKLILNTIVALCAVATTGAYAATAQQEKMKTCNADAKTKALKGDERKAFMKDCLSAKPAAPAAAPAAAADTKAATQQDKMKACNKDAGDKKLKGADRKQFMSTCLKG
ncbi:MAG: phosphate starvation-inducible protein PsiF [Zoogloea sp.]|nr:phosphate starvation-inducible protein PsiF [Zoogloea sp.]